MRGSSWSTQQLTELVAALSIADGEDSAAGRAVERAADALDADIAAIVRDGELVAATGYADGAAPLAALAAIEPGQREASRLPVPGVGTCAAFAAALEDPPGSRLVIARQTPPELTPEETGLLRAMASVTAMRMRTLHLLAEERAAHEELKRLADEQVALRRVATSVARGDPPGSVFAAVAEEVGGLIPDADVSLVGRYTPDRAIEFLAGWSSAGDAGFVGTRVELGGRNVSTLVFESGHPARTDYPAEDTAPATLIARNWSRSSAGAPIKVEGELWGVVIVGSLRATGLPHGVESRLADFTQLLASAIANAQAGEELQRQAEKQAALRRVATLVARSAPSATVFATVAEEVGRLVECDRAFVARYEDRDVSIVAAWSSTGATLPVQARGPVEEGSVSQLVRDTGKAARVDEYPDYPDYPGDLPAAVGMRSAVAAPITVEGRIWGLVAVGSGGVEVPAETEARLADFAELLATAIANTEARDQLRRVAGDQAALRRVATLVARGAAATEIFDAVTGEVHRLLQADETGLSRYDPDGLWTVLAIRGATTASMPVGFRLDAGPSMPGVAELLSGRSVRVDASPEGTAADDLIRAEQLRAWVASPVVLMGRTWGQIAVFSRQGPLPAGTEERLADFTDLVASAIANAEAGAELHRIADQQAALRRVATLVAEAAPPSAVFTAVAKEVVGLLGVDAASVGRYHADGTLEIVAAWSPGGVIPVGLRRPPVTGTVAATVRETRRPARVDRYGEETREAAREVGIRSAVAVPITVEGRLWGLTGVASTGEAPPRPGTEERLAEFTELVATAIANANARAELTASRARIVASADEMRRKIERDIHDGAQQRLVSLGLQLRAAQAAVPADLGELAADLDAVVTGLDSAFDELRELARGVNPRILVEGGLEPAIRALARRSTVPVELDLRPVERLPRAVETAAYYAASEALANAAKHAEASVVRISMEHRDGSLRLAVSDDGLGGAEPTAGTGLIGLIDRADALGGTISVDSRPARGTSLVLELPIEHPPPPDPEPQERRHAG